MIFGQKNLLLIHYNKLHIIFQDHRQVYHLISSFSLKQVFESCHHIYYFIVYNC